MQVSSDVIQAEVFDYFKQLAAIAKNHGWQRDSEWTVGINEHMAALGHIRGYSVHASRCPSADGPEWLYDHHWRMCTAEGMLVCMPLVLEIEWGFGSTGLFEKVRDDFLKLIQARADLRVLVFQGNGIDNMTDRLIQQAKCFVPSQSGDRYIFAGYGWDTQQMHCRLWSA